MKKFFATLLSALALCSCYDDSSLQEENKSLRSTIQHLQEELNSVKTESNAVSSDIYNLSIAVSTMQSALHILEAQSSTHSTKTEIANLISSIEATQRTLSTLSNNYTVIESRIGQIEKDIPILQSSLNNLTKNVNDKITIIETSLGTIKGETESISKTLDNISGMVEEHDKKIKDLESRLSSIEDQIAKIQGFGLTFEKTLFTPTGDSMTIPFGIKEADSSLEILTFAHESIEASVSLNGTESGNINITFLNDNRSGSVLIAANCYGVSKMYVLSFEQGVLSTSSAENFTIEAEGGNIVVNVTHNLPIEIKASAEWVKENAATRAMITESFSFSIEANSALTPREADIIVSTTDNTLSLTFHIHQKERIGIILSDTDKTLSVGDVVALTYQTNVPGTLSWSSSNTAVATVDSNGNVTGVASGSAVITVSSEDGKYTAECNVRVTNIADLVSVSRISQSTVVSGAVYYVIGFRITNSSSETIHLVSLAGVNIDADLAPNSSYEISLQSTSAYLVNYKQTLLFTFNGKQYSVLG